MIVSLTGRSGAGKTSLLAGLRKRLDVKLLTSITTRTPRSSDIGQYRPVSRSEFMELADAGKFLASFKIHGELYGTLTNDIDTALMGGLYMPELNPDGVRMFHTYALERGKKHLFRPLYLRIYDEDELRRRMQERGDAQESIKKRILESRPWNDDAALLGVRMRVFDAQAPQAIILQNVHAHLLSLIPE